MAPIAKASIPKTALCNTITWNYNGSHFQHVFGNSARRVQFYCLGQHRLALEKHKALFSRPSSGIIDRGPQYGPQYDIL